MSQTGDLFYRKEVEQYRQGKLAGGPAYERDICANRHKGAQTSVVAHKRIRGGVQARREAVYEAIKASNDGLTVDELAESWNEDGTGYCTPNAISGRFSELARDGRIRKCGTRPTRSGCPATIWEVK